MVKKGILGLFVLLSILIGVVGIVGATTINVPGDHATIQAAINSATTGDIISVSAGTYPEDLIINKPIELVGTGATIKGVANVPAINWPLAVPNIDIQADGVKIHGFTIQGPNYVANYYSSGIVLDGQNIEIYDNDFVTVRADTTDELGQAITTYSKTAILTADVSGLNIHDNTFTGTGTVGCEAIYINPHTGTGTIYIDNNQFSGSIFIGISAESGNINLANNTINTNVDAWYGVRFFDTTYAATYDNIEISDNTIQDFDSGGIRIGNSVPGASVFVASILSNTLSNNDVGIWGRNGNDITANYNNIFNNVAYGIKNDGTIEVDAENNWWGHMTGPNGEGPGIGDPVSDNVDFAPWLVTLDGTDTEKPESHIILTGTQHVTGFTFNLPYVASDNYGLKRVRLYENGGGPVLYDNLDPLYPLSNSGTFSRTVLIDGVYTYYTRAVDIRDTDYGGAEDAPAIPDVTIIVDTTSPTGTISLTPSSIISDNDLTQEITITYNEPMDTSYTPMINFTNNIGAINSQGGGFWDGTNKIWTETFLVEDANEETVGVVVASSLARDIAGNTEGISTSASFNIDTKAPVISDLSASTTDIEINNDNDVTISAKVVEGESFPITVWAEENSTGSFTNCGLSVAGDIYSCVIDASELGNQEYVGWRYYATDNLGNLRVSEIYGFFVENRAPEFTPSIGNLSWIEDGNSQTINLSAYFYDLDYDELNYTYFITYTEGPDSNPLGGEISVEIDNDTGIATISSTEDWNGWGTTTFTAIDEVGATATSNTINLEVLPDGNEIPVISSNESFIIFEEDTTFNLVLACEDPEDDCFNFRYDEDYIDYDDNLIVNVNPSTGAVTLTTKLDWAEVTYVRFLADDDNSAPLQTGSLVMKVNVTPVNDNPLLDAPDITLKENDGAPAPINLLSYTTDVDNNVLTDMSYTFVSQSNESLIDCNLNVNVISCSAPNPNMHGVSELIVEVIDGIGGFDTQKITVNVEQDGAPVITSYSPTYNPIVREDPQEFSIIVQDNDDPILTYVWRVDGAVQTTETTNSYTYTSSIDGEFIVNVTASDALNTVSHEWTLTISSVPVANTFTGIYTTNFSGIPDLSSASGVILENDYGKIEFLDTLDLSEVFDLDSTVKIEESVFAIDTSVYPQLNKPARITLTGLSYNSVPEVFYSNQFTTNPNYINDKCDFCEVISYTAFPTTSGIVVFEVEHFSSFVVVGSGIKYNISEFDDLEMCVEGEQGDLIVEIEEPNNKDDFGPGDEIEIEVNVKNNADEDKKIIVEAYLYNVDEDEEIEDAESEYQEIRDGRSEDFDLIIVVPDDFEEDDNYILFVKAYEKSDEEFQCNYDAIEVELEREKHKLIISEVSVDSSQSYAGGSLELFVEVNNMGGEDEEEVYITIEQSDLGISEKSDLFEIEQYGDDDRVTEEFKIDIPKDALIKDYDFEIKVVYDDGEDSKLATVPVIFQTVFEPVVDKLDVIELTPSETVIRLDATPVSRISIGKKAIYEPEDVLKTVLIILVVGILVELIAIVILRRLNRRKE